MRVVVVAALIGLAAALPSLRLVENLDDPDRISGEYLVVLHPTAARTNQVKYASEVADKISALSSDVTVVKRFTNLKAPIFLVKSSEESVMSSLFQLHEVDAIQANSIATIQQCSSQSSGERIWGLSRISSTSLPNFSSAQFSYGSNDGAGVRVYVLDTGIRLTHQDFGGRAEFGLNVVGGGDDDVLGHGTHCAGTAVGSEFGVAKAATVVSMKVFGDHGGGPVDGIVEAIDYAVAELQSRGVRGVLSMSLGSIAQTALDSAVDSAEADGVPVVTSAGNGNRDACLHSPARAAGAITVGNTDIIDGLYSLSNHGSCVDILAPGTDILSASHESDTGSRLETGTSMSCPHVSGVVAKYLSDNPNASPSQVRAFLTSTATPGLINLRGWTSTPNLLLYTSC